MIVSTILLFYPSSDFRDYYKKQHKKTYYDENKVSFLKELEYRSFLHAFSPSLKVFYTLHILYFQIYV